MGFNSLPPLPIISIIFGFLKSVDLRTVGLELGDVLSEFRWALVLFELSGEQIVPKGVLGLDAVQSGPEPGSQPSEARTGPTTAFLD